MTQKIAISGLRANACCTKCGAICQLTVYKRVEQMLGNECGVRAPAGWHLIRPDGARDAFAFVCGKCKELS